MLLMSQGEAALPVYNPLKNTSTLKISHFQDTKERVPEIQGSIQDADESV